MSGKSLKNSDDKSDNIPLPKVRILRSRKVQPLEASKKSTEQVGKEVLDLAASENLPDVKPKRKRTHSKKNRKKGSDMNLKNKPDDCGPQDIEDSVWEPENWAEVLDNIMKMRKMYKAPVDSMGSEHCPDQNVPEKVRRYQTLISVMLSSQTRDEVTHAASKRLIAHGLTVENILETSDEKLGELIYPVGFWKSKIRFIKKTTVILRDEYESDIPSEYKDLCKLPGVGPKIANLVMSIAWGNTVGIAVDTHVHRIANRLRWVQKPTKQPEQTRISLQSWLPKDLWESISFNLVGFGQTICKPTRPNCKECLALHLCPSGR